MEIWKDIEGYEGLYQVSNEGRIKSLDKIIIKGNGVSQTVKEKIMKGYNYPNGYKFVTFGRKSKCHLIHRLVAEAFIPNPDNKPCVDHINGNRDDNRVENLRWCTHKENSNFPIAKKRMIDGQKNKLKIYQYSLDGELIAEYESINDAARENGYLLSNIWAAASHYGRLKTYKGYKWSYEPL